MKKILALLVTIGLGLFIWKHISNQGVEDVAAAYRYKVDKIRRVSYIDISEPGKAAISLQKKKDYWLLNDQYRTRANAIENLLAAIKSVELQFIPQPQAVRNIMPVIRRAGVTVDIFDKNRQLLQSFVLGGVTADERGTYILKTGFQQLGVVTLPGFEGSLMPRFQMSEKDWRDRTVLGVDVDDIEFLKVKYPNQPDQSFEITKLSSNQWTLRPLDSRSGNSPVVKAGAIEAYLRTYKSLGAEDIILDDALKSDLQNKTPFVIIDVRGSDGYAQSVALYPLQVSEDAPAIAQIDRYQVLDKGGNVYLIQHRVFKDVFWGYDQFLSKN